MPLAHPRGKWTPITWVILGALAIRLAHLVTSLDSPLFWKPGPDEEFYRAFGLDVAGGRFGFAAEYAFMDPLYGYVLGAVFWLFGDSLVPVYLLQIGLDATTAWMLWRIGNALGKPQVGLIAASLHALTATALLFSLSLMKATWVAALVTGWIWLAISLAERPTPMRWLAMGLLLGLAIALRANLLLLAGASLLVLPVVAILRSQVRWTSIALGAALMIAGTLPSIGVLALRNAIVSGTASITPNNGGIVLHHLYNRENPNASTKLPTFVRYAHPSEIWRAYRTEAERLAGEPLAPSEVDAYWRREALEYIRENPGQTARNMLRKAGEFVAWPEVPNNRSFDDERRFAPMLRLLPPPFGFLFALGVPGLLLWLSRDIRALVPLSAVAVGLATVVVFFAEDRFRFNIITPFTLGAAITLCAVLDTVSRRQWRKVSLIAMAVLLCAGLTLALGSRTPKTPLNWERVAWGYVLMGKSSEAARWVDSVARETPSAEGIEDFRGFLALQRGDSEAALRHFDQAISIRNRHETYFNRSLALERLGRLEDALADATIAASMSDQPDYALRVGQLLKQAGRYPEAGEVFFAIIARSEYDPAFRRHAQQARLEMEEAP